MKTAIITTSTTDFNNYRNTHNINAKQIARKSDLDGTVFDEVIDLDPKCNVTDWVRDRIKSKVLEE